MTPSCTRVLTHLLVLVLLSRDSGQYTLPQPVIPALTIKNLHLHITQLIPACDLCSSSVLLWRRSYRDRQLSAMRIPTLHMILYYPGLVILTGLLLSSGGVYVRRGDNITDCSMKCPHTDGVLELYRVCGGDETPLLELWCDNMWHYNRYQPRLLYNTTTGCWSLTAAGKDDSCLYNVVYYGKIGRFLTKLPITVLDPVLISNITSNSSRPGQDIAVTVQFSGEEAAVTWEVDGGLLPARYRLIEDNRTVIIPRDDAGRRLRVRITNPVSDEIREYRLEITDPRVLVRHFLCGLAVFGVFLVFSVSSAAVQLHKKTKTKDEKRDKSKLHGIQISNSSLTDRLLNEEKKMRKKENSFIQRIWNITWKIPKYEPTQQRDKEETTEKSRHSMTQALGSVPVSAFTLVISDSF